MELRDYVRVLRKNALLIALCVLLGGGAAALATWRATPLYSATVTLVVSTPDSSDGAVGAYQGNLLSQQRVKSYADLVSSDRIAGAVAQRLGLTESPGALRGAISAVAVPDTVLLRVSVTDPAPSQAQRLADAVAQTFTAAVGQLEAPSARNRTPSVRVSVWEPAKLPTAPVSPRPVRNVALGVVLGLLFGVGGAVLRDRLDTSLKTPADVTAATGLPTLGTVAYDGDCADHPLVVQSSAPSPRAESLRQLRTNLRFLDVDNPPRSIVVTSSVSGEGKSTTVCNLAVTLAQAGVRVALVEADLRRPSFGDKFGIETAVGLTSVLIGLADLDDALQPWGDGRLTVLPSGPVPPNPSELLGSNGMADLLGTLRDRADLVLMDAPPLLPVTDAAILAALADGALLVTRARRTRHEQLRRATEALRTIDARVLGVVLNMVPTRGADAYGYGYRHGYAYEARPNRGRDREAEPFAAGLLRESPPAGADRAAGPVVVGNGRPPRD